MKKFRWKVAQFFEKNWWKNYLRHKDANTYLQWKTNYWLHFLNEMQIDLSQQKGKLIDIGCGPAGIFILSQKYAHIQWTALDPLLMEYQQNLTIFSQKKYPLVHFEKQSFENYSSNAPFETIFCLNAINHFIYLQKNLSKLYNLLAKNGTLVLSIDAHNYSFLKHFFAAIPFDILHPHQYTAKEYEQLFMHTGFKIRQKKLKKKERIFSYFVYVLEK